jgi:1-acyl-sn-glycerol-3-phosphate acyltransferase
MKFLYYPFYAIYRIWFYLLVLSSIILLFPFLITSIISEKNYKFFFALARIWAKIILFGMGYSTQTTINENISPSKSYMFIANHTSMLDIMLMLKVVKNPFVFVGKKELSKIPLFGFFYKRTCILVDRNDQKSRKDVYNQAEKRLKNGLSICIFPEGLVPDDESIVLAPFKDGAFSLSIEHQLPIVPICFLDNKQKFSYTFFSGSFGTLRTIILPFIPTKNLIISDRKILKEKAFQIIHKELLQNL